MCRAIFNGFSVALSVVAWSAQQDSQSGGDDGQTNGRYDPEVTRPTTPVRRSNIDPNSPIRIIVDGQTLRLTGQAPIVRGGRVLVPLRIISERLASKVGYNARRREVTVKRGSMQVRMTIGSPVGWVNGRRRILDEPARVIYGTTLVPMRFLAEALNAGITYFPEQRTVRVDTRRR